MAIIPTVLGAASVAQGLFGQGGLFGKKRKQPTYTAPDISGELAKLDQLYAQQGELLKQSTMQDIAGLQRQTAQSLANRGIFSSPVSQKAVADVERQGLLALARGQAGLLGEQAQARSAALNNLLQYQQAAQRANNELALQRYMAQRQGAMNLLSAGSGLLINQFGQKKQPQNLNVAYPGYNPYGTSGGNNAALSQFLFYNPNLWDAFPG